ncbi:paraquat-inducible protein A [Piscinibacter sp.]|jgi:paraquat-inducible protein A|uniref:paraquat-inducible protein A n=1 Tax=Piscinibacter sp. TaxID=1903157 RepID=UPI002F412B06
MVGFQQDFVVCEQCAAAHRWRPLHADDVARCTRCSAVLARGHRLSAEGLLALTLAALCVLLIANLSPIVSVGLRGQQAETTLAGAIAAAWRQGEHLVATLAALTAIAAPAVLIGLRLLLLLPFVAPTSLGRELHRAPRHVAWCMRVLHEVSRWNMVEVLMVAALVAIVRVAGLAQASAEPGMFAFGALSLLLAALEAAGLRHLWWSR